MAHAPAQPEVVHASDGADAAPAAQTPYPVIVVGAGFVGIGAAIRLRQAGIDFLLLEKGSEMGGVWRDNSYPGCGCDVPSALYSYSFAPNPLWSRFFAQQGEIKDYTRRTAEQFGVMDRVRLQHELLEARWVDAQKRWRLHTSAGVYWAQFVVMASGPMHVPVLPHIKGLDTFTGAHFHSARWDHGYNLRGKRVAVIGSGASAIQFVPHIAPLVQRLTLFQRTAPWVLPKFDPPITARWHHHGPAQKHGHHRGRPRTPGQLQPPSASRAANHGVEQRLLQLFFGQKRAQHHQLALDHLHHAPAPGPLQTARLCDRNP